MIVVKCPELELTYPFGAEQSTTVEIMMGDLRDIQPHMIGYFTKGNWIYMIVFARIDYYFKMPVNYWDNNVHYLRQFQPEEKEKVNWAKEGF